MIRRLATTLLLLAAPLAAQGVGTSFRSLPQGTDLYGLEQTPARDYSDFLGQSVLIEFFAYW